MYLICMSFHLQFTIVLLSTFAMIILCSCILSNSQIIALGDVPDFSIAAVGDWGCNPNTAKTIAEIVNSGPSLVIGLGDNSYELTGDCWLNMIQPISKILHTAFGNHDASPDLVNQYLKYFKLVRTFYSFNFKNIHFVTIDTNAPLDINSEQYKFVKNDLEMASSNKSIGWIIPFFHIPAYTTPSGETILSLFPTEPFAVTSYDLLRNTYQPLFDKYRTNIVLQAHAHNYQRSYPILFNQSSPSNPIITNKDSNSYLSPKGEIFLTVGTGGRSLHQFLVNKPTYVITEEDTKHGFLSLKFTNNGTSVRGTFYPNESINPEDNFTIEK
jgi:calcineurin-like phosphoesterase family protein